MIRIEEFAGQPVKTRELPCIQQVITVSCRPVNTLKNSGNLNVLSRAHEAPLKWEFFLENLLYSLTFVNVCIVHSNKQYKA